MSFEGIMEILARNKRTAIVAIVAAILIALIYFAVKGLQKGPEKEES